LPRIRHTEKKRVGETLFSLKVRSLLEGTRGGPQRKNDRQIKTKDPGKKPQDSILLLENTSRTNTVLKNNKIVKQLKISAPTAVSLGKEGT